MFVKLNVGEVAKFVYNGKVREVRVEKVESKAGRLLVTGFDYRADGMRGAYRSFDMEKANSLEVC